MLSFVSGVFYFFVIENHRLKDGKLCKQVQTLKYGMRGSRCEKRKLGAVSRKTSCVVRLIISLAHFVVWSTWWSSCFGILCLPLQSHPSVGTVPQGCPLSNACVNQNGKPRPVLSLLGSTYCEQNGKNLQTYYSLWPE